MACVRDYLKKGYKQQEAVTRAVNDCIEKGILKDVLEKHRAEVVGMFLTTFDKKMYEEALREEGREEIEEEKRLLEEENATLAQQIEEKTQQIDRQTRMLAEQTKQLEKERRKVAELEVLLANQIK